MPTLTRDSGGNGGNGVPQNPYTFAGTGVRDRVTGWVHYANRYYNTRTGTWTQQDSLDAPLDPTNANRYAYAGGDPINNTDPTGRDIPEDIEDAATTIGTFAVLGPGLVQRSAAWWLPLAAQAVLGSAAPSAPSSAYQSRSRTTGRRTDR